MESENLMHVYVTRHALALIFLAWGFVYIMLEM